MGRITVPSDEERKGNFSLTIASLSGCVSGPYLAEVLSRRLGEPCWKAIPTQRDCSAEREAHRSSLVG